MVKSPTDVIQPDTISYNRLVNISFPDGSAGAGDQELLIYDLVDSTVSKMITIIDPGTCSGVSSVDKVFGTGGLKAIPNPFSDQMSLEIFSKTKVSSTLVIYDVLGKTVYYQPIDLTLGQNEILINTSNLPSGFMIVKVISENNYSQQVKILKK